MQAQMAAKDAEIFFLKHKLGQAPQPEGAHQASGVMTPKRKHILGGQNPSDGTGPSQSMKVRDC